MEFFNDLPTFAKVLIAVVVIVIGLNILGAVLGFLIDTLVVGAVLAGLAFAGYAAYQHFS